MPTVDARRGRTLSVVGLLGLFLVLMVIQFGSGLVGRVFGWDEVDYADLGSSAESLLQNVLAPDLVVTAAVLVVLAVLGWWYVAREDRRVPKWMWLFPLLIAAVALVVADWGRLSDLGGSYIAALAVSMLVVAFNEEFIFRAILLNGFRQHGSEVYAWAFATALFALSHGMNLFGGSTVAAVVPQILQAFILGTIFYLTKRVSGTIVIPILIHALWDFSFFSHGGTDADVVPGGGTALAQLSNVAPLLIFVLFGVILLVHKQWTHPEQAETVSETA